MGHWRRLARFTGLINSQSNQYNVRIATGFANVSQLDAQQAQVTSCEARLHGGARFVLRGRLHRPTRPSFSHSGISFIVLELLGQDLLSFRPVHGPDFRSLAVQHTSAQEVSECESTEGQRESDASSPPIEQPQSKSRAQEKLHAAAKDTYLQSIKATSGPAAFYKDNRLSGHYKKVGILSSVRLGISFRAL